MINTAKKPYHLVQIKTLKNSLNVHRTWFDKLQGIIIISNDDLLGNKFRIEDINNGEHSHTVWYASPTMAAIAFHAINTKNI